jgi:hypothetical protein
MSVTLHDVSSSYPVCHGRTTAQNSTADGDRADAPGSGGGSVYREVSHPLVCSFFVWTDPHDADDRVKIQNDCSAGKIVRASDGRLKLVCKTSVLCWDSRDGRLDKLLGRRGHIGHKDYDPGAMRDERPQEGSNNNLDSGVHVTAMSHDVQLELPGRDQVEWWADVASITFDQDATKRIQGSPLGACLPQQRADSGRLDATTATMQSGLGGAAASSAASSAAAPAAAAAAASETDETASTSSLDRHPGMNVAVNVAVDDDPGFPWPNSTADDDESDDDDESNDDDESDDGCDAVPIAAKTNVLLRGRMTFGVEQDARAGIIEHAGFRYCWGKAASTTLL